MGRKRRKQLWWIILFILVVLLITGGLLVWLAPEPPRDELKLARESLAAAQKAGAEVYAASLYQEAHRLYDSVMVCWAVQNDRFFINRNYGKVQSFAKQVTGKAIQAKENSILQSRDANLLLKKGIPELEREVELYERIYKHNPLPSSVIRAHNKGRMKLSEARIAFDGNRFNEAKVHYQQAVELITSSNTKAEKIFQEWFAQYPVWKKHGNEAIRLSRSGKRVILIDKYAHRCMIYQGGKVIRQFDAEFGMNWMGDKLRRGDKATPEGIYRITQKKDGARTKFHRALLINFPNDEDRRKFAGHHDMGGLIEIHGLGGKGVDWTDGCVALKNEDMDVLFSLTGTGTPVIIVGSLRPISEIR